MFRAYITFTIICLLLFSLTANMAEAKTRNKKKSTSTSHTLSAKHKKKNKKKNKMKHRASKSGRYKQSRNGLSLRALTTEKPNSEYVQNPENGVNSIESKSELQ